MNDTLQTIYPTWIVSVDGILIRLTDVKYIRKINTENVNDTAALLRAEKCNSDSLVVIIDNSNRTHIIDLEVYQVDLRNFLNQIGTGTDWR